MQLTFVIPNPDDFRSGGNLYNRQLLAALRQIESGISTVFDPLFSLSGNQKALVVDSLLMYDQDWSSVSVPVYFLLHHLESLYPPPGFSGQTIFEEKEHPILRHASGFIVSSRFTEQYLRKQGLSQGVCCIEPALEEVLAPPQRSFDRLRAIIVANLVERKGILPFLQELIRQQPQAYELYVFGSEQMEPAYAASCLSLIDQLPGVQFGGSLPQSELFTHYRQANLFVSTSFMETFGMAIQEARQAALPLLLMEGGYSQQHLKDGNSGWSYSNIQQLVHQFVQLTQNPQQLKAMQPEVRQSDYTWRIAAKRLIYFFEHQ